VCASGKGGAGKTTVVSNLGIALAELGIDVVAIDANLTTPNLGFHLGIPLYPTTIHDVLKGRARLQDAMYRHSSGLKIIPAGIGVDDIKGINAKDLSNLVLELTGKTDIVLIDAAAGLGKEALSALESADEMIVITNPELPAVTDALKAIHLAQEVGTKIRGVVVNRIEKKVHELTNSEISNMLGAPIIAEIPEDSHVRESIAKRVPILYHKPKSKVSREIRRLAAHLVGKEYKEKRFSLFSFFRR